jgi:hypothetical protein
MKRSRVWIAGFYAVLGVVEMVVFALDSNYVQLVLAIGWLLLACAWLCVGAYEARRRESA